MKQDGVQVDTMGDEAFGLMLLNHADHKTNPILVVGTLMPGKSTFFKFWSFEAFSSSYALKCP